MFQIRIHGRGGQGVVTAAEMLSIAAFREGRHAQAFPSFGSERTGAPVVAFCRIDEREIRHSGVKDRGFMDSIYFEDPLGLLIELSSYRFEPPFGYTHADVLLEAHKIREDRGDYNIAEGHLADAIEALVTRSRASLSDDRSPRNPYS